MRLLATGPVAGLLLLASPLLSSPLGAEEAATAEPLSARHQSWLDQEAVHAITAYETAVFVSLPDAARAGFAEAFWAARDPTPGTRPNERRELHLERMAEARRRYVEPKERGWEGRARVRLHALLGAPDERQLHHDVPGLRPIELWIYRDVTEFGLPPWLQVILLRPVADAPWVLYDPVAMGPQALLEAEGVEPAAALDQLENAAGREVRTAAVSVAPAELVSPVAKMRTPDVVAILGDLGNRVEVDLGWVRRHLQEGQNQALLADLDGHGVAASFHGAWVQAGAGVLQYAVQIPPSRLTLVEVEGGLRGSLEVVARIVAAGDGRTVQWIDRRVELRLTREGLEQVGGHPLAFEDLVPMVPGDYEIDLFLRDRVSRFSVFLEGSFEVPAPPKAERLALGRPLVVARQAPSVEGVLRPFVFGDRLVYPAAGGRVHPRAGKLEAVYQIAHPGGGEEGRELRVRYRVLRGDEELIAGFDRLSIGAAAAAGIEIGSISCALPPMLPAEHRLVLEVTADGLDAVTAETTFSVTPLVLEAQPWVYVHELDPEPGVMALELALQAERLERPDVAAAYLQRALSRPAVYAEARLYRSLRLLAGGEHAAAAASIAPLGEVAVLAPVTGRLAAEAHLGAGDAALARAALEATLEHTPRSVRMLNDLVELAVAADDDAAAIPWLERSLAIQPDQRDRARQLRALESAERRRKR